MPILSDPSLLRTRAYIDGAWTDAEDGAVFAVTNPATGARIGDVPDMGAADTRAAIAAAGAAFPAWAARPAKERGAILYRFFELMMENQEDLARLMTAEQGKPLSEARGEVVYAASFLEWYAEEAKRAYGDIIPAHKSDARTLVMKQPIGVVAAITPWNFPSAMITRKCAPAWAAGCPAVIKPAEDTPLSALALAELAERAGLPKGVLNIVTAAHGAEVGQTLCDSPVVRKLSFTGSTEVGKILYRQSADTMKKLSLELGGNASFIVFDDADLDRAVTGAMASKFRNTGQTCVCANRFFVQDGVYEAFTEKLAAGVAKLTVGDGLSGDVQQGPLINTEALAKVQEHVADAVAKGAKVVTGGKPDALGGTFYAPTILTDMTREMKVTCEETFGPLAALYRFKDQDEVIELANDTPYGLASYFYTRDLSRAFRVAEALETGSVGVNEGIISTEVAPFGGVKESGLGREGSKYGLDEYMELKYVLMGGI